MLWNRVSTSSQILRLRNLALFHNRKLGIYLIFFFQKFSAPRSRLRQHFAIVRGIRPIRHCARNKCFLFQMCHISSWRKSGRAVNARRLGAVRTVSQYYEINRIPTHFHDVDSSCEVPIVLLPIRYFKWNLFVWSSQAPNSMILTMIPWFSCDIASRHADTIERLGSPAKWIRILMIGEHFFLVVE